MSTFLDFGGLETRLANISCVNDENEWVFCCLNKPGNAAEQIRNNGKRVINLNVKPTVFHLVTFFKVWSLFRTERPDVVHTSGAEANFYGILAAKFAGVPKIIGEEIGIPSNSKKARFIFSAIYMHAHYVIGNSIKVLEAVHKLNKVSFDKLANVPNPVIFKRIADAADFEPDYKLFNFISVSRLEQIKNISGMIRALKTMESKCADFHYYILGEGTERESLINEVDKHGLGSKVTFLGYQSNPLSYVVKMNLYVLNSFSEGFSNSLVEAMYAGVPSLSTRAGAAEEIIADKKNGFLTEVNNEDMLCEKLLDIIFTDKNKLKEIGKQGQETVMKNYSLENHINRLMNIYN